MGDISSMGRGSRFFWLGGYGLASVQGYPLGPVTPLVTRRQALWTFMGGGFFTYSHNQNWRMEPGFLSCLNSPGANQVTIFQKIVRSRPWWEMIPDQSFFANGITSENTLNTDLRSVDSSCAMIYLSSQCHVRFFQIAGFARRLLCLIIGKMLF